MTDFATARRMMVDGQVRTNDVTDLRIIGAMLDLPRERFVSDPGLAYLDRDVAVGGASRRLLKPMVLAKMLQAVDVNAHDRVLDIGCATGYSSALLAKLAARVTALEEDPALARRAADNLKSVCADNASVVTGALAQGWPQDAPYDVIFVNGATEVTPDMLCRQLAENGRLIAVMRRAPTGQATIFRAAGGEVAGWPVFDAAAPLLPGFAAAEAFVF
ncbi:MAG: protein-L-isoaspartate O-methyltransferase [Hyphomicrobiales bacterium]|nr:protein-L-isoaspartate O-methyltransferase [Hyphomicrobiales bacterium]